MFALNMGEYFMDKLLKCALWPLQYFCFPFLARERGSIRKRSSGNGDTWLVCIRGHGWSGHVSRWNKVAGAARATVQYGWPSLFKSRPYVYMLYTIESHRSSRTSPTQGNASHLFFSQSYSFASSPVPPPSPPSSSSVLSFHPLYKVSSRFNPKLPMVNTRLLRHSAAVVLVFFMHGIRSFTFVIPAQPTFALR